MREREKEKEAEKKRRKKYRKKASENNCFFHIMGVSSARVQPIRDPDSSRMGGAYEANISKQVFVSFAFISFQLCEREKKN